MTLTEQRNLRSGTVPWREQDWNARTSDPFPQKSVDVAILGSGISGAILAERLASSHKSVAVFDRRPPAHGSTAASTAQVMWAMDFPLSHLAEDIGEAEAARRWTRVYRSVREFADRIDALGIDCGRADRPTVYLAGNVLDEKGLAIEADLHRKHGLPSSFLPADAIAERFGISPRAGIVSEGAFDVDPVKLCHGLLDKAARDGARIVYPVDVVALHPAPDGIVLETADGQRCHAGNVILATGYERALLFLPPAFSLLTTFAIATPPMTLLPWRENAMIWEAADPYLYVRSDPAGRIIAGGEDIESSDENVRDRMMPAQAGTIAAKAESLLGSGPITIDRQWAATFGSSPDSLPAIGRATNLPHVWLAAGYGGNGIAFAGLAGDIVASALFGIPDPDLECFDPYRFS